MVDLGNGFGFDTHAVYNQPSAPTDYNLFESDSTIVNYLHGRGSALDDLVGLGELLGRTQTIEAGRLANEHPPILRTHDRNGNRIDEVEFHPAWHSLMTLTIGEGVASYPDMADTRKDAHLKRAVGLYLVSQVEAGHGCPVSMTYAAVPTLRHSPELAEIWEPGFRSHNYDFGLKIPSSKAGLTCGMAMTEKQGGSDVRAITTTATLTASGTYRLVGHKWFCSAPMSDAFMTLAQSRNGLSCFLVPRVLEDGILNGIRLQRLKDKVGNRSNASSEIELAGAIGHLVGEEGRGIKTILEMVGCCRLDSLIGAAAQMRQALVQALWFARRRSAFSSLLIEHDLMQNVLLDLILESEASSLMAMRMAHATDQSGTDEGESDLRRIGIAISKFLVCKRAPTFVAEAMECLGGSGYVEESLTARLYREAPLNGIWEGAGNVNALDTLRAMHRQPSTVDALLSELSKSRGFINSYDGRLDELEARLVGPEVSEWNARQLVGRLGLLLQSHLMIENSMPELAAVFVESRLGESWGAPTIGCLPKIPESVRKGAIEAASLGL